LQPGYADAHSNLGEALVRQGRLSEAEGHLREAVRLRPDIARSHLNLGLVLQEQRRLAEAEASLRQALVLRPDYGQAHNALGQLLREQNRLEEARASFEQALRLNANDATAHCNAAKLDYKERTRLRQQVRDSLRADLALRSKQLETGKPADRAAVQQAMQHWQRDSDLAGIRDAAALAKLPAEECAACERLWADVAALLKKAEAPATEDKP
jgi:tetratricopeptide (TPR) repeat protein